MTVAYRFPCQKTSVMNSMYYTYTTRNKYLSNVRWHVGAATLSSPLRMSARVALAATDEGHLGRYKGHGATSGGSIVGSIATVPFAWGTPSFIPFAISVDAFPMSI
jgi:hypothetical protein